MSMLNDPATQAEKHHSVYTIDGSRTSFLKTGDRHVPIPSFTGDPIQYAINRGPYEMIESLMKSFSHTYNHARFTSADV